MLRRTLAGLAASALVAAGWAALPLPSSAGAAPDPDVVPGSYIVTLRSGDPGEVAKEHGNKYGASIDHVYRSALRGYAAHLSDKSAARLAADPQVASVVADRVVTISKGKPQRPPTTTTTTTTTTPSGQTLPTGINRIDGELSSTVSGDGGGAVDVDVAVIDTGSGPHPDLHVVGGVNCSSGTSYNDGNGHGTHVAGTIGAYDNGVGVVGVAPGARIWSVRVLNNQGSGSWSSIICGIEWVTNLVDANDRKVIEVANMSLGGSGTDTGCNDGGMHAAICDSVNRVGITYAVAAGNESDNAANHVPASYDEVITVSALADFNGLPGPAVAAPTCRSDGDDTFANFSNFGADVDLIAPGVCIRSTWKGGGYNTISGTSMASPHVAGAAALYLSTHAGTAPSAVKSALEAAGNTNWSSADDGDSTKERLLNVDAF